MTTPFPNMASMCVRDVDDVLEAVEHDYTLFSLLENFYDPLHRMKLPGYEEPFLVDYFLHLTDAQIYEEIEKMNRLASRSIIADRKNHGFPPGNWYMLTITQHTKDDLDAIKLLHEKTMSWLKFKDIEAHSAAIEKASAYHVHYAIRIPGSKTNLARDLSRHLDGRRVRIENRVNTLKKWNGLHKYIAKDGYDEKADTQIEILFTHIHRVKGKGWVLEDK